MVEINEIDFVEAMERSKELSLEEQIEFISALMVTTMGNIKRVAEAYAELQSGVDENEEKIKSVVKGLEAVAVRRGVLKDILKGNVDFNSELFKKEVSGLKKYTKDLRKVYII